MPHVSVQGLTIVAIVIAVLATPNITVNKTKYNMHVRKTGSNAKIITKDCLFVYEMRRAMVLKITFIQKRELF